MVIDGTRSDDRDQIKAHLVDFYSGLYREPLTDRPMFPDLDLKRLKHDAATEIEQNFTELQPYPNLKVTNLPSPTGSL